MPFLWDMAYYCLDLQTGVDTALSRRYIWRPGGHRYRALGVTRYGSGIQGLADV